MRAPLTIIDAITDCPQLTRAIGWVSCFSPYNSLYKFNRLKSSVAVVTYYNITN